MPTPDKSRVALAAALLVLGGGPTAARATYSIVATDQGSRQVGGSGTSCVGSLDVRVIYGSVPGKGAVHAQALLGSPGLPEAVNQLASDIAPADIIATITDPDFDSGAERRQFGIVDLMGRSAGFTGMQTGDYAEDRQGQTGTFTYSVQGNILTSAAVLDQSAAAFGGGGCDLADRLMLALEAGALNGEGDSRCTPYGIPSDSAFIQVEREGNDAEPWLSLSVTGTAPDDPLPMLRAEYDAWRATHACPASSPDAGPGSPDGGPGGDAGAGATDAGLGADDDAAGCGCRAADGRRPSTGGALAGVLLLMATARRGGRGWVSPTSRRPPRRLARSRAPGA